MTSRHVFGTTLVGLGLIAALAAPARAGDARLKLELGDLAARAKESVNIVVDKSTLDWAVAAIRENGGNEAELRRLMTELDGIYVQSLDFGPTPPAWSELMEASKGVLAKLDGPGWTSVISSTEQGADGGEIVRVSLFTDAAGKSGGLAVFALERAELTLVNIVGPVKLEQLARIGTALGNSDLFEALGGDEAAKPKTATEAKEKEKPAKDKPGKTKP